MASSINMGNLLSYQNAGNSQFYSGLGRFYNKSTMGNANQAANLNRNTNVDLSAEGLSALQNQVQADSVDTGLFAAEELSPKAQAYLEKLREQYGDYNFVVADNIEDAQSLAAQSDKQYSVVLSSEELEKMADSEEYAQNLMGKVDDAVKTADSVMERAALEGVQINQLTVSFDENGNTKLFATLEKLSDSQQERLEAAKERAAESKQDDESIQPQIFTLEADDEESFLEQLLNLNLNWNGITES